MIDPPEHHQPDFEALAALADNRLDAARREVVLAHLHDCAHCTDLFAEMVETMALDEEEDEAVPPDLTTPVVPIQTQTPPPSARGFAPGLWVLAAAVLAAGLLLVFRPAAEQTAERGALVQQAYRQVAAIDGTRLLRFHYPTAAEPTTLKQARGVRGGGSWARLEHAPLLQTLAELAALLQQQPADHGLRADLAAANLAAGRLDHALVIAAELPRDGPEYGLVFLARYLAAEGEARTEAFRAFRAHAEQFDQTPFLVFNLSVMLAEQGEPEAADLWRARYEALAKP
ncbi:anti-sigma factor family protein [Acanthopleuribacter pedis]|uniref:Zinc-finger domain-containing protein n=1 Tax=Acanthopleuribacter pedis TaxID=442870 RepID=A0A8J7U5G1_9BACT|nr:hypothetical protein [Acanthopleuribacter pedis]MBO1322518.1 hypothetical protein [Acanthopleuribacter pedis]